MALIYTEQAGSDSKTLTFDKMAMSVGDLREFDLTDEYQSACALLFTLARFETDFEAAKEMLDYINGPEDVSNFDLNFIKGQLSQYPYVARSYFQGSTVDNGYEIGQPSVTIKENPYSRQEENYVQLLLHSSGADSDRMFKLRRKPSTGEWFVLSDTYRGLLAGIRAPKEEDDWA